MIVKVYQTPFQGGAVILNQAGTIRRTVILEETLLSKMCRRSRAYFQAKLTDTGEVMLFNRLPDQGW